MTDLKPEDRALVLRVSPDHTVTDGYGMIRNWMSVSTLGKLLDAARTEGRESRPSGGALRPEVLAFAHLMEAQLRANDHKPGWKGEFASELFPRILEEAEELREAIDQHGKQVDWGEMALYLPQWTAKVGCEAADVANFAMMIADVCGALPAALSPSVGAETLSWRLERAAVKKAISDNIKFRPAAFGGVDLLGVKEATDAILSLVPSQQLAENANCSRVSQGTGEPEVVIGCDYCREGDPVPPDVDYWKCPRCDAEWYPAAAAPAQPDAEGGEQ